MTDVLFFVRNVEHYMFTLQKKMTSIHFCFQACGDIECNIQRQMKERKESMKCY